MKKGFTLVELLAVLLLLGVIGLIAIPAVGKILDRSRARALDGVKNELIQASKKYTADNLSILPTLDTKYICISITTLVNSPHIAEDQVIDPTTEKPLAGFIKVTYRSKYDQYNYEYILTCTPN